MALKLGVPSKGRLMDKTFDWFGARGVTLSKDGSEREYSGRVEGVEGVELVLLAAGEIPRELNAWPTCNGWPRTCRTWSPPRPPTSPGCNAASACSWNARQSARPKPATPSPWPTGNRRTGRPPPRSFFSLKIPRGGLEGQRPSSRSDRVSDPKPPAHRATPAAPCAGTSPSTRRCRRNRGRPTGTLSRGPSARRAARGRTCPGAGHQHRAPRRKSQPAHPALQGNCRGSCHATAPPAPGLAFGSDSGQPSCGPVTPFQASSTVTTPPSDFSAPLICGLM